MSFNNPKSRRYNLKLIMIPIAQPYIGDEEKRLVMEVLDSGMLVQGPKVAELERRWAEACEVKHAIAVVNGTAALHVAMLAHGIGPGDEVITTPFTFMASVNSIMFVRAKPVFVDIHPDCFNINVELIEATITSRTKAILPVHLYGLPAHLDELMAIARKHNLVVIEDAAQAIGAEYKGRKIGGINTSCFSLYATKNVMSGEGGMITTNDDEIARMCRLLRQHGMERRYYHDMLGYNFRLSDLHAAIGLAQLGRLNEYTRKRRANAEYLTSHINNPHVVTPKSHVGHAWHQYTIRIVGMDRDEAVRKLTEAGIGNSIFYPVPAHKQKHVVEMGYGEEGALPVAEQMAREVVSLPVWPGLGEENLAKIVTVVNGIPIDVK
jgi:dTDP-4-amino-4,6-dideoxygalactose transaminase